jgi:hypothetical protein
MAIKATTLREDHVSKRETPLGRWFPVILYAVNLALWIGVVRPNPRKFRQAVCHNISGSNRIESII